ncbi:MAG: Hpt domain-containing protein [Deltaproteobacteria bacterium]|nr:Hpt domain-containing protein [Deltaproteobacteria bacterium]
MRPNAHRLRFHSVGWKIAGATVVVVTALAAIVHVAVSRRHREYIKAAKQDAARMVIQLTAAGLSAPVVFGDTQTTQEQLDLLESNEDVLYAGAWLVSNDKPPMPTERLGLYYRQARTPRRGHPPASPRERTTEQVMKPDRVPEQIEQSYGQMLISTAPIVDLSGRTVGVVQIAFSLARERAADEAGEHQAIIFSATLATFLASILLLFARFAIIRPLHMLSNAANRLERGERATIDVQSKDEIGDLATALRAMSSAVQDREAKLKARNNDMRLILDNAGEGFVTVTSHGKMADERSKMIDEWFGPPADGATFFDFIATVAGQEIADWMTLGCEALHDGFLPLQVAIDQLPKQFSHDGRYFALEYRPILQEDGTFQAILVVIRNITAEVEFKRSEALQREALALFQHYVRNRIGLIDFFRESRTLVDAIIMHRKDEQAMRRNIHTLKGNAALFGVERIAEYCHRLESKWSEDDRHPSTSDLQELSNRWRSVEEVVSNLGAGTESEIIMSREEHARLLAAIRSRQPHAELESALGALAYEPAARRLAAMREQVLALGERYGKPEIQVEIKPTPLRLPSARWARFWPSLVHIFRNAVDHGLEDADERSRLGKPPHGRIVLSFENVGDKVVFAFEDDGRGIAWTKLAERAAEIGLQTTTKAELEQALYSGALSSRGEVTELSGRGIGISAVNATIQSLGGTMSIASESGHGTSIRFAFPSSMLKDDAPTQESSAT